MLLRPFARQHATGCGELLGLFGWLADPDGFGVGEFADAVGAEFAAMAGGFDAAEGNAGIGGHHLVDEDHACFEFVHENLAFGGVVGPGACTKAEAGVVGHGNGFFKRFHTEKACDWAEQFLAISGGTLGNVGENRRRVEIAGASDGFASGEQSCARLNGF